jgi:hypothetical protein
LSKSRIYYCAATWNPKKGACSSKKKRVERLFKGNKILFGPKWTGEYLVNGLDLSNPEAINDTFVPLIIYIKNN